MTRHTELGGGGEFDLIRALERRWGSRAAGMGDDAALVEIPAGERLVVSSDASVEGVHFRRDWFSAQEIGYRATVAALSDLAAMGARPLGVLFTLVLPAGWRAEAEAIAEGVGEASAMAGAPVIGGDISRGEELVLSLTVLGSSARPLLRSGAAEGQDVFLTGRLGGPAAALRALMQDREPAAADRVRLARPEPRIREALWLAAHGATAAVDVSDGVASDLGHIAAASGMLIELDLNLLPLVSGADATEAAASGEEYELIVSADPTLSLGEFAEQFACGLTRVGRVVGRAPEKGHVVVLHDGERVAPPPGHDHLS